jgi:hypothetical protein
MVYLLLSLFLQIGTSHLAQEAAFEAGLGSFRSAKTEKSGQNRKNRTKQKKFGQKKEIPAKSKKCRLCWAID